MKHGTKRFQKSKKHSKSREASKRSQSHVRLRAHQIAIVLFHEITKEKKKKKNTNETPKRKQITCKSISNRHCALPKDKLMKKKKTQITFAKIQITLNKQKQKSKTQVGKRDKE
jgi:hypothetical protein